MTEGTDVRDHINKFNKCITQLLRIKVKIEEERAIILLVSLPKSFEKLLTALLVGKMTLIVNEVLTTLLETENIKHPSSSSYIDQTLIIRLESNHGKSKSRGRYDDRSDNYSQSRFWKDVECYYSHKKGHVKRNCEELTKHLEAMRNQESKETPNFTEVVDEGFESEYDILSVIIDENFSDS